MLRHEVDSMQSQTGNLGRDVEILRARRNSWNQSHCNRKGTLDTHISRLDTAEEGVSAYQDFSE